MANCEWKTDSDSGAETLFVDGVEKIRISDAANMRADEGRQGASLITVDELKEQMEKEFCGR
ncbi:hypothetical protein [Thalassolituus sp.]|uniref:hypothetical protein n=1 Tax=Thalassolituus sp. TaxID=2030822 RepID=UPI00260DA1C2|nr:hypothetical protein [Thalassolituus sp.]